MNFGFLAPYKIGFPLMQANKDGDGGGSAGEGDPAHNDDGGQSDPPAGVPQEKVNRLVGDARNAGRTSAEKAIFEKYGVNSQEELDALVDAARQAEDANKSELEKAQATIETLKAERDQLAQTSATEKAALEKRVLDTEIKILAAKAVMDDDGNISRPAFLDNALDDVLVLISRDEIVFDNGGYRGINEALEQLAKAKPYLTAQTSNADDKPKGSPPPRYTRIPRNDDERQSRKSKKRITL